MAGNFHYDRKKKDTLRPDKKRYSRLSDGCAVLAITTGKKKIQSSVWQVVLLCQFLVLAGNKPKKKRYSRKKDTLQKKKDTLRLEKKDTVLSGGKLAFFL